MNIAVCDDEKYVTGDIEERLYSLAKNNGINIDVDVFFDGQELAKFVNKGNRYDIIYLDIEMKYKNGLDAARDIRKTDKEVLLIYVTSHESYCIESFEVSPFRFMVKPINDGIFEDYFKKAYEYILKNDLFFNYRYDKSYYRILVKDILYFESDKRTIYIVSVNGKYKFYGKLNDIENKFSKTDAVFLRIHQSFLINYRHIRKSSYDNIELSNGTKLGISEDRREKIGNTICDVRGNEIIV